MSFARRDYGANRNEPVLESRRESFLGLNLPPDAARTLERQQLAAGLYRRVIQGVRKISGLFPGLWSLSTTIDVCSGSSFLCLYYHQFPLPLTPDAKKSIYHLH